MKLYLVRHATAADIAPSDAQRPLTREGEEEAQIVGAALHCLGAKPLRIFASPLLRAQQTARIAAQALSHPRDVEALDELRNDTGTEELLRELRRLHVSAETMLVGHMPSIAEHLVHLIGEEEPHLGFGKGCVACVDLPDLKTQGGRLVWFHTQKHLREFAKQDKLS